MADLSKFQIDWIKKVSGKPITDATIEAAQVLQAQRESFVEEFIGKRLAESKDEISKAQVFVVTKHEDDNALMAIWKKARGRPKGKDKEMAWRASDSDTSGWEMRADVEVDTDKDIPGINAIPDETLDALNDSFAKILLIQQQMLNKLDADGNPMFSDEDIRRELWTPLVREGTIPDNMVPDRFSEQAIAFAGAADIYQKRIDQYSEQSTGKEDLIRGLGIAKETIGLVGAVVSNSVTIANANEMAKVDGQLTSGNKAGTETPLTGPEKEALKVQKLEMQAQQGFTTLGVSVLTGGFDIFVEGVKEKSKGKDAKWHGFVDKALSTLATIAANAVGPIASVQIGFDEQAKSTDDAKAGLATAAAIKAGILGSISAVRIGPALISVALEDDPNERRKLINNVVDRFADAVGQCFTAIASDYGSNPEAKGKITMAGAGVSAAIKTLGRGDLILKALMDGKPGEAAVLLGGGAIQGALSLLAEELIEVSKRSVTAEEFAAASPEQQQAMRVVSAEQDDGTQGSQEKYELKKEEAAAALITKVQANMQSMEESILADMQVTAVVPIDDGAIAFQKKMSEQISKEEQALAEEKLGEFFADKNAMTETFADIDKDLLEYEKMYQDAVPDADLEGKPADDVARALDAIDQAIAKTAALRARVDMINAIADGGVGIIGSFIPGGGAVIAAKKVLADIYALTKAVQMHNKWVENMEISFRAYSAYSPAIEKTMDNAKITMDQKGVDLVLHSLKCGAEVGKCFDPTGASAIVSGSLSITEALVQYGYKMQKEVEITRGWNAYVKARGNPANRKAARKALRMNSTLAKCCIAYGACMANDPAAQEAIKRCGISPALLADDKAVCNGLVAFLENELRDDPVVMHVEKQPKKWQPGKPELFISVWFEMKAAALTAAEPKLHADSAKTPAIDRLLAQLQADDCWNSAKSYAVWRSNAEVESDSDENKEKRGAVARKSIEILTGIKEQFQSYRPIVAGGVKMPHEDMADIAMTFAALAEIALREADRDRLDGLVVEEPVDA
ncbi:hypothetical protein GV827_16890 [Sulfitobacter sp. JBTF-M27]|uniref:Uncharacterized protein n=1 Tax=Sulfitobacter sediminilitoris TaxID=2698830 RepID=A0A6P0CFP1_9RHOB|nr:hypothetical protein [Sulfitobacter sediminilitoris]NEK24068.1 hypothetical protein [Sulfitobacter sediminilitoris]